MINLFDTAKRILNPFFAKMHLLGDDNLFSINNILSKTAALALIRAIGKGRKEKIEKLKEIDWTKDNTLPNFPKSFLDEYGLEDKNIIDRNFYEKHKDVDKEKAIKILDNALYKTDEIFHGREDRPNYYNFIYYTDDGHSDLVLVEIEDKKDNYEIVHFYRMNKRGQRKLEKRTNKLEKKS